MALGARSRLWAGHRRPGGRFFCGSPMLATKGGSRRRRDAAGPAVPPPPPATPPFDRSHGVAITPAPLSRGRRAACRRHPADRPRSRRPRPPKRAAGTFRGPRPLAMAGGDARHQLAFPPAMAHLAASLGRACPPSLGGDARYGFRCTESSCPLRGWASRARRRSRRGLAAPLRGRSRQCPEDGTPLRGRSCRARAAPCGALAQGAKAAALSARGRSRARLGPSRGRAPSRPGCRAA